MIKDTNIQKSIVIPKELEEKIVKEAKENYGSFNWVIRKVLTDYFRDKEKQMGGN